MLDKKYNKFGQKDWQIAHPEIDRTFPYRSWMRTQNVNGYFVDVDQVKFRYVNGKPTPVAIVDLTCCDETTEDEGIIQQYLNAVSQRYINRDSQGASLIALARKLEVPMYLVCFQKDLRWMYVYHLTGSLNWQHYTFDDWAKHLSKL